MFTATSNKLSIIYFVIFAITTLVAFVSQDYYLAQETSRINNTHQLDVNNEVTYFESNYIQRLNSETPNQLFDFQWHYKSINLHDAWNVTTGDASVIVAVIDTGVFMGHEDLSGVLLTTGYDFVASVSSSNDGDGIDSNPDDPGDIADLASSSWHGTHVAGTIAAKLNALLGTSGVASNIKIMPIRAFGERGYSDHDITQAIRYASGQSNDSGTIPPKAADIICLAFGNSVLSKNQMNAIKIAQDAGIIVIASAGNNNSNYSHYPSDYPGVISVGAVGMSNKKAYYSNFGASIDLVAPGGDKHIDADKDGRADNTIASTSVFISNGKRKSGYALYQGTSMATAHVVGVIGLMKSIFPDLTTETLNILIAKGMITTDLSGDGVNVRNDTFGYGMIDALKAVQQAQLLASNSKVFL